MLTNDNEESRRVVEQCYKRHKTTVNPIIDWTDTEVWEFIKANGIPYCEIYDCGFKRLGCIGCPMAGGREQEKEFAMWPKYRNAYLLTFDRMLEERKRKGKYDGSWRLATATDVMNWWVQNGVLPGQMTFDDYEEV